ncbi:MAG: glycosyltransferase [Candidatus Omnitrophica bacterium]|nr:glycosyltransferase [Candidatus Omnitrophota bacterium]
MKRLAVIPSDPIAEYLKCGYSRKWLRDYYNPCRFFDEVYLLSPLEENAEDLLGMKVVHTLDIDLIKRIKDLGIDVVRAYGGNWACRFACEHKVKGVPVVVSVHDTNPAILYDSIKKADIVLCVAKAVEELVATKFKKPDRSWILPNRVDFEVMRPVPSGEWKDLDRQFPFKYKVLLVGRLNRQKNLDTLIKALKFLGKDYGVIAIGKGDDKVYRDLAIEQGVDQQYFLIDSVAHEELTKYYSWCDCMCTPSRWEGFGIVFIEALACEAVVVTSDIGPMNEFITNGENGLLVKDHENPQALANVIQKACTGTALRAHLKKNARTSVEPFERTKVDQLEAGYYQKILSMKEHHEI